MTPSFASRAGAKLAHALDVFQINPSGLVCTDLGCSTGGFVDCLLQRGATKVYAVDTGYGVLDWKLRNDQRVVVIERTNALHVKLPEPIDLITIDVGWTPQRLIIPHALKLLKPGGNIISLIKPHYESAPNQRQAGTVIDSVLDDVLMQVRHDVAAAGVAILHEVESPLVGGKGGNREWLWLMKPEKNS